MTMQPAEHHTPVENALAARSAAIRDAARHALTTTARHVGGYTNVVKAIAWNAQIAAESRGMAEDRDAGLEAGEIARTALRLTLGLAAEQNTPEAAADLDDLVANIPSDRLRHLLERAADSPVRQRTSPPGELVTTHQPATCPEDHPMSTPDPISPLTTLLDEVVRAARWRPGDSAMLGTWLSPDHSAQLEAGEPDPEFWAQERFATISLTGALGTRRPWKITGECAVAILPALLDAALLPPNAPAPDPASVLPRGDYFREHSTGNARGSYWQQRWIQWEAPGPFHRLEELEWFVPGSKYPDLTGGWRLWFAGGHELHADLATPRPVTAALVTAMTLPPRAP